MNTYTIEYLGRLRTRMLHEESGSEVVTDAPKDNEGEGSAFSPTDIVSAAMGSCMLTIIGIRAGKSGVSINKAICRIEKIMGGPPRRIVGLKAWLEISISPDTENHRRLLEEAARNCPVILSLSPEIEKEITFRWLPPSE
jgi:uncharacterized OsmC-like protein